MFPLLSTHLATKGTKPTIAGLVINLRTGIINSFYYHSPDMSWFPFHCKRRPQFNISIDSIQLHSLSHKIHRQYHRSFMPMTIIYYSAAVTYNQRYNNITPTVSVTFHMTNVIHSCMLIYYVLVIHGIPFNRSINNFRVLIVKPGVCWPVAGVHLVS